MRYLKIRTLVATFFLTSASYAFADLPCPSGTHPSMSASTVYSDSGSTIGADAGFACGAAGGKAAKNARKSAESSEYCNGRAQMTITVDQPAAGGASPATFTIGGKTIPNTKCHCQAFGANWLCGNVQEWEVKCCIAD